VGSTKSRPAIKKKPWSAPTSDASAAIGQSRSLVFVHGVKHMKEMLIVN
jgi:hypothetical protein